MSALIFYKEHIDLIVAVGLHGPQDTMGQTWGRLTWSGTPNHLSRETANMVGAMLLRENHASVNARYGETALPSPYAWESSRYRLTVVEALKAIDCYEYQSCEHPAWERSSAFRFCQALRDRLIGCLPGYSEAPWVWTASELRRARAYTG